MADRPLLNARANKSLGQHFLFDPDILRRTALAAGSVEGQTVVEIGPGPGGLTHALLEQGAETVLVIEADSRFAESLRTWPEAQSGRLHVVEGDATQIDIPEKLAEIGAKTPAKIIANLPYNVGTPLVVSWLKAAEWRAEMALMFQHEVAARLCADPGDKHYGRLAVLAQAVTRPHIAFTLPPGAFKPPPKVDSSVAVFQPLSVEDAYPDLDTLEKVTAAAFGQRRKMLRASLKQLAKTKSVSAEDLLNEAGIDPTRRAETVSQMEFRALTDVYKSAG